MTINDITMACFCEVVLAATVDSPIIAVHADRDICRANHLMGQIPEIKDGYSKWSKNFMFLTSSHLRCRSGTKFIFTKCL